MTTAHQLIEQDANRGPFNGFAEFARYARGLIVKAGLTPVKADYDPKSGNCTICGECGRCPGWHTSEEVQP